jgi:hypothetical protein
VGIGQPASDLGVGSAAVHREDVGPAVTIAQPLHGDVEQRIAGADPNGDIGSVVSDAAQVAAAGVARPLGPAGEVLPAGGHGGVALEHVALFGDGGCRRLG